MMNDPMLENVMQRLSRLEWENRCWNLVGIAAGVMLGLVVLLEATGSKEANVAEEIQARRFVVVDGNGKPRVVLGGQREKGVSELVLLAEDGRIRAKLDLSYGDDSPALAFYDKNSHRRAYLAVDDWGSESAQLQLIGKEGSRVNLSAWSSEESRPEFRGQAAVSLSNEKVNAGLNVVRGMAELQFSRKEAGKMVIDQEKGTIELKLVNGTPELILADRLIGYPGVFLGATDLANPRTGVQEKRPVSSILLFNKNGKVIWSAP